MELGKEFIKVLDDIGAEKGLPIEMIASSIETAMVSAYKKYKTGTQDVEVHIDLDTGEMTIAERFVVSDDPTERGSVCTIEDARAFGYEDAAVGDVIYKDIAPESFGRIAAQTARQVIIQKLKDAERQVIFSEFADRIGEMVVGTIFKVDGDQIIVKIGERSEALLPKEERIAGEMYEPGDRKKFLLLDVRRTNRGSRMIVSRSHPALLKHMLKLEVPEIQEGIVEIRSIVREAGMRAKVAVTSLDANVDPVGACIGSGGARIKAITDELCGERVDVIIWSSDPMQFVRNALSPAKATKIEPMIDQEKALRVFVRQDQLSLAIGRAGQNVRLAARLTGWKIDIKVIEPERLPTMQDLFEDIIKGSGSDLWEELPKS